PQWVVPAPSESSQPTLIRPSDVVDDDEPTANSPLGARGAKRYQRGILVHTLLSRLPDLAVDQRESAARRFLKRRLDDNTEINQILSETLAVLTDARFAAAFAPDSRAEVALTAELPELGPSARVSGRIDRLAVSDTEVLIVDFKTNRSPPKTEDEV